MKMKKILSMLLAMSVAITSVSVYTSLPVFASESTNAVVNEATTEKTYVYGTMNIPYDAFYKAEIGNSNEVPVDAVTSATASKWKNFAGSYYTAATEGEGGTILGAKYSVAIESDVYETLKSANSPLLESFVESTEVPVAYKVMDKDGNFSAVNGTTTEAEGVTATLATTSTWGDYQLTFEDLTVNTKSDVAGAIIETTDGTKYGLRHLENLWLKATELSWGSGFKLTEAKGNTLSYAHYESMMGKTISKITYICTSGNVTVSNLNIYVPVKYNGTFTITDADQTAGAATYTMDGFPTDGNWKLELPEGLKNASYANGTISYSAETLPGSYTVTAKDANNKYAETSTSFNVKTDKLPVEFKDGQVVALENVTEDAKTNYIKNIATVNVKFGETTKSYKASGHGSVAIVAEDGTVNMAAASKGAEVFAENGTYELTVTSNGYPELTFTVEKKASTPTLTATPVPTLTATPVPTKVATPVPTKVATPTPTKKATTTPKVTTPKKSTISKVTNVKGKKLKVVWKKDKTVTGYQIQIATNKKFTKGKKTYTIKKASTTSKTITGLKKKKTYYVKVRAYKASGSKKVYGKYSAIKKVTIKK
ncbi:MAG: fibronectin type III domain-containing protein [Lachnospiraceae bacterium]|nr:fibronectin type III domain-containing protein [Lachnospiraceae bacterium]